MAGGIILFIVLIVSIFIFILSLLIAHKQKVVTLLIPPKAPLVTNFMSKFTDGHSSGVEISAKKGKTGRYICKFIPNDLAETFDDDRSVKSEKPEVQEIVVENRIVLPTGTLSSNRELVWYLPNHPTEIHSIIKHTPLGDIIDKGINAETIIKNISVSLKNRDDLQSVLIRNYKGGEYSQKDIEKIRDAYQSFIEILQTGQVTQKVSKG